MDHAATTVDSETRSEQWQPKGRYSAHNFTTSVSLDTQASVHDCDHNSVVRIFVGLS